LTAWGGGVDALVADTREAIAAARSHGHALPRLKAKHLAESAGYPNGRALAVDWAASSGEKREPPAKLRERDQLAAVLAEAGGDLERAAASIGVVPEALAQWMRRHGL
jgi:transcriptional regulator with GAF, ATPase, and Fis domain